MIDGFPKQTCPLDDYETTTLLPIMVRCLSHKVGKENAVSNRYMCNALNVKGYSIGEARVRKLINHIRTHNLVPCLLGTSGGYYVTKDPEEMKKYIQSLQGRIEAISEVLAAMQEQLADMPHTRPPQQTQAN